MHGHRPNRPICTINTQVQAGSLFMTGCTLTINNGLSITATVGQAVFVGGE